MPDYKLYFMGRGDHIEQRVDLVGCDDEAQAIRAALERADGRTMELWLESRLVKRFERTEHGKQLHR